MPKITLQPQGAAAPLTLEVEWTGDSGGLTSFTLTWEGESLSGQGRLGPQGEGILRIGPRTIPFYVAQIVGAAREPPMLHLWLGGEIYHFVLPSAPRAGQTRGQ